MRSQARYQHHEAERPSLTLTGIAESIRKRETCLYTSLRHSSSSPAVVVLRLATVVNFLQASLRKRDLPGGFVREAYEKGVVLVNDPKRHVSFLSLDDFGRAMETILEYDFHSSGRLFHIYNLQSFDCSVEALAIEVSHKTGAKLLFASSTQLNDKFSKGESISSTISSKK